MLYKRILKPGERPPKGAAFPTLLSNVTIEFNMETALGDPVLTHGQILNTTMLQFPLMNSMPGVQKSILTMLKNERSLFIMGPKLIGNATNLVSHPWLKFDVTLCQFCDWNSTDSRGLFEGSPLLKSLPPPPKPDPGESEEQHREKESDQLISNLEVKARRHTRAVLRFGLAHASANYQAVYAP
eukprot:GHVT01080272.1.p2 GENE.GHVT01080272.1~~GHVT01080272.1.p2  ORF type:complete len:184 (+),score=21.32 GHVT01080272.1:1783-2334(+)